jgi:uncharacterized membrane protein
MPLFKRKELLPKEEQAKVVAAIQQAEKQTSGELRVFVESRCKYVDAIDRAAELFFHMKMEQTKLHNGVIVYVALQDKQSAILGDTGIYKVTGGPAYWKNILKEMNTRFRNEAVAEGLVYAVSRIGATLSEYFPYDPLTDKNELPDDIVFGK